MIQYMTRRYFALIPAAGHSTRMRGAKLLMPLNGRPLILHTIAAWQHSRVDQIVIVVRPDDRALADTVQSSNIQVVVPESPPPDMKASLQAALKHVARQHAPTADDAFLVAPADMPRLSPAIIDRLIAQHGTNSGRKILAPTLAGRRGHPVLFPWTFSSQVHALAADEGLDAIVHRYPPMLVACEDLVQESEYPFADIDTPEDYERITGT
jgi:molybdenum cofactor cytidylyltransferase